MTERNELLRELMAVFDDLPQPLRDAINYAPEPLDPKSLAILRYSVRALPELAIIRAGLTETKREFGFDPSGLLGRDRSSAVVGLAPQPVAGLWAGSGKGGVELEASVPQHQDSIGDPQALLQIVRGHHAGAAGRPKLSQSLLEPRGGFTVQSRERLVEQHHFGGVQE